MQGKKPELGQNFYLNRNATFLQELSEQKAKREQDIAALKEAEELRKQKLKLKILGSESKIKSKVFDVPSTATISYPVTDFQSRLRGPVLQNKAIQRGSSVSHITESK